MFCGRSPAWWFFVVLCANYSRVKRSVVGWWLYKGRYTQEGTRGTVHLSFPSEKLGVNSKLSIDGVGRLDNHKMAKRSTTLLLLALFLHTCKSSCPNYCSSHGVCNIDTTCTCYTGYTQADCSLRSCPVGIPWFGIAASTDTVHSGTSECSSVGTLLVFSILLLFRHPPPYSFNFLCFSILFISPY